MQFPFRQIMQNIIKAKAFLFAFLVLAGCNSGDPKNNATIESEVDTTSNQSWQNLSDSKNLSWHSYGKNSMGKAWKVENDMIYLNASVKNDWQTKDGGDIVTN